MGKSEGNAIYLIDDAATIRKKVMKAVTDSGPTQPNSEKPEAIANLFTMLKIVSSADTYDYFNEKYNACEIRYGDLKKQLAEDIVNFTSPIREEFWPMPPIRNIWIKWPGKGQKKRVPVPIRLFVRCGKS